MSTCACVRGLTYQRPLEPQRCAQHFIAGVRLHTTRVADHAPAESIHRLDTGGAVLGLHFIEPIEQRQDLVCLDPGLTDLAGYVVLLIKGVDQPVRKGAPLFRPR